MANNIIRWNPVRELAAMQTAMDRLFEDTWRDLRTNASNLTMSVDVHENESAYTIVANLPGVKSDDIQVTLHDGVLTISAEARQQETREGQRVLIQERSYGQIARRFSLPQVIDSENVIADYTDGVLTLTLPKTPDAQPRQIPIKTTHNQN